MSKRWARFLNNAAVFLMLMFAMAIFEAMLVIWAGSWVVIVKHLVVWLIHMTWMPITSWSDFLRWLL